MTPLLISAVLAGAFDFLKPVGDAFGALRYPFEFILGFLVGALKGFGPAQAIGVYGLAIILLTIFVKSLLFPLFQMQLKLTKKAQDEQRKVAPELAALRKKYKGDAQKLNTEMMALYKEHGINPLGQMMGCLPVLVQMPVLIGLYRAIYDHGFYNSLHVGSNFVGLNLSIPASLDPTHWTTWILPALAGITTFIQSKMYTPPAPPEGAQDSQAAQAAQISQSMSLIMPVMIVFFSFQKYALQGLVLYWIVNNLFSIGQQYTVNGWGQLPILGKKAPKLQPSTSGTSRVVAPGKADIVAGGTKPASRRSGTGRTDMTSRKARRH